MRYNFICLSNQKNAYYWDLAYIWLRLSLIIVNTVFHDKDVQKLSLSLIVLTIFLLSEIKLRPFNNVHTQWLSYNAIGTTILTLLSALFLL